MHSSEVTSLSACDRWLVSGDSSGVVRVVDMKVTDFDIVFVCIDNAFIIQSGRLIESREHSESILSVVCLPVHEGYLTCCRGGVINLWSYPRRAHKINVDNLSTN